MIDANKKKELRIRMPPAVELAESWKMFFQDKFAKKELIRDSHAVYALTTLEYVQSAQKTNEAPLLSTSDIAAALEVLSSRTAQSQFGSKSQKLGPSYIELANQLYANVRSAKTDIEIQRKATDQYMQILCLAGQTQKALDLLRSSEVEKLLPDSHGWYSVLRGFVGERNADAVRLIVKDLGKDRPELLEELAPAVTRAFAILDAMAEAKQFYSKVTSTQDDDFYMAVITSAIRNNEIAWGRSIIQQMMETPDIVSQRRRWDTFFVWAAGTGKSVDEVDRMMQVMVRRYPDFMPDTTTINQLVAYAISQNDAYLAERFLSLGTKWNAEPDALTYLYQMDYRLSNGDVDGAITAYFHLQDFERSHQDDIPRINRLIQAMCSSSKYSFESIMGIVDSLSRRRAPFDAETTAALCILHLKRDEYYDVTDLLRTHAGNYDTAGRALIRDAFLNFCLDRRNSVARVWDTYMIFQQVFDAETPREPRTRIMNELLKRRRSDMAVHVFNHMREHARDDTRATADTYVAMLTGIGRLADDEGLEVVHNQMKLDMRVEPGTRLNNARMLAFLGCDRPRHAFSFWKDIIAGSEGPNYNSLLIVMRICEKMPFGETPAKEIWSQLRTLDVEVTPELLAAYVGALAANDLAPEAKELCENAQKEFGFTPDAQM